MITTFLFGLAIFFIVRLFGVLETDYEEKKEEKRKARQKMREEYFNNN